MKEGKEQALLVMTLCFMLAVFYFEYWLQDLVSLYSRNFKEINLKPWLHSFLLADAYFTCVQVDFVNVSIVWKPRVEGGGLGKTCCLTLIGKELARILHHLWEVF